MVTKAEVMEKAREVEYQEIHVRSLGAMNTPADIPTMVEQQANYRMETDKLYRLRMEYTRLFDRWYEEGRK